MSPADRVELLRTLVAAVVVGAVLLLAFRRVAQDEDEDPQGLDREHGSYWT